MPALFDMNTGKPWGRAGRREAAAHAQDAVPAAELFLRLRASLFTEVYLG